MTDRASKEIRRSSEARASIGIFSYGLPRADQKRGGFERVTHDQAQGLARLGYHVTVWTYDPKPAGALYEVRPLPWKKFYRSSMGPRFLMGYLGNILAILPDYRGMDLLIAHGDSLLMPLLGKPLIRVMHGSAWEEARKATGWIRWIHQMGVYGLEILTSLTQSGAVAVSKNTLDSLPFIKRVISNGVDLAAFQSAHKEKTKHPSLLFVGALGGRKRGNLALEWFQKIWKPAIPDLEMSMVCEPGPAISGVTYHYGISDEKLAELYRRAWVYISPSTYEGFGLPYVEAMASGTPVVATPNPGSHEVLDHGSFGILASDEEFSNSTLEALKDPSVRDKWIELGMRRSQDYSLDNMANQYASLIESMLEC